ncbi:hypothetical protein C8A01DRAFT_51423 [Parachaetomium inaequale]|uniref:Uncharacterized protein n=1 Tax=Parachaetomium inaequale TaxID=2588326 RepID=A0AAN6SLA7_9PEZI|nr:hypothetical protein C8A01DRAFT_51423 [Parachaetomium inaequale]
MVKTAIPLAALAMAASWVEDIIAHPDMALTVDEAVEAAHAADIIGSAGGLQKRGRDAAACVDYVARVGALGYNCGIPPDDYNAPICCIGGAQIVALQSINDANWVNCNDVVRTAGLIFDNCWRADDRVMGIETCINSPLMEIGVLGV